MKLMFVERPSTPNAACAQVGVLGRSANANAHVAVVGRLAVRIAPVAGARRNPVSLRLASLTAAPAYGIQGTSGLNGKGIVATKQRVDGASGVPPRGRPV